MWNPFKKRYKISETKESAETYYWVKYGTIFSYEYLLNSGSTCGFWSTAELYGGKFQSLSIAKEAIFRHATSLIDERLNKPTTKTIQYV